MLELPDMRQGDEGERGWAMRDLDLIKRSFDILFDRAPVMMHAVDKDFKIVKVNHHWLQTLGYKKAEVLDHPPTDFLTEGSRAWAVEDVLPLFWHAGSDRSVGMQFVRKDGRVLDLLVDAEVCAAIECEFSAYAALRTTNNPREWEQASTTIRALKELTNVRRKLEDALLPEEGGDEHPVAAPVQQPSGHTLEASLGGADTGVGS